MSLNLHGWLTFCFLHSVEKYHDIELVGDVNTKFLAFVGDCKAKRVLDIILLEFNSFPLCAAFVRPVQYYFHNSAYININPIFISPSVQYVSDAL